MKKKSAITIRTTAILMASLLIVGSLLTGCGTSQSNTEVVTDEHSHDEDENVIKKIYVKGTYDEIKYDEVVTLGDYSALKDLQVEPVTEESIMAEVNNYLNSSATSYQVADRSVVNEDRVNISVLVDNKEVLTDIEYKLGAKTFGQDFDDILIGMNAKEEREVETVLTDAAGFPDYSGLKTNVRVTLNYIVGDLVTPELNDTFVQNLTGGDLKTVDELKNYIKEYLANSNQVNAIYNIFWEVKNSSTFMDIDELVEKEMALSLEYYQNYAKETNTTYEDTIKTTFGYESVETFENQMRETARDSVEQKLVVYSIANKEGIKLKDNDYKEYLHGLSHSYGYESTTELINHENVEGLRYYCVLQEVIKYFSK